MKKILSIILCILLAVSMVTVFSGCSGDEKVTGKWEADFNLSELLNAYFTENDETMAEYIKFNDFNIKLILELNEDNTYKKYADSETLEKSVENLKEDLKKGLTEYYDATIASGMGMTVDEILQLSGITLDELVDQSLSKDMVEIMLGSLMGQGMYELKDGKFYISYDVNTEPTIYNEIYELKGNELKLMGVDGQDDEFYDYIYPLVFKKVS